MENRERIPYRARLYRYQQPKIRNENRFLDGLLTNENGWLEILESRNITSHVYDERTAATIFDNIKKYILRFLKSL